MLNQPLEYRIECHAVVDVAGRYFHLQHISVLFAYRVGLIRKALLVLALVEHAAFRVGGGLNNGLLLRRC